MVQHSQRYCDICETETRHDSGHCAVCVSRYNQHKELEQYWQRQAAVAKRIDPEDHITQTDDGYYEIYDPGRGETYSVWPDLEMCGCCNGGCTDCGHIHVTQVVAEDHTAFKPATYLKEWSKTQEYADRHFASSEDSE